MTIRTDGIVCKCNGSCDCHAKRIRENLVTETGHAYASPSSLGRVFKCPASLSRSFIMGKRKEFTEQLLRLNDKAYLIDEEGEAASDGSKLHAVLETSLLEGITDEKEIMRMVLSMNLSESMVEDTKVLDSFVELVVRTVSLVEEADWYAAELKVRIKEFATFGTCDLVFRKDGVLYIYDLKTGRQEVQAEHNVQLSTYALGALNALGISRPGMQVQLGILAVRFKSSYWDTTCEELGEFVTYGSQRLLQANSPNPPAEPGDHCLYCQAKLFCREWKSYAGKAIVRDEETFDTCGETFNVKSMEELVDDYMTFKVVERYIGEFKQEILERCSGFGELPDGRLTIVEPKPRPSFKDEGAIVQRLKETGNSALITEKAASPSTVQKLDGFDDLIELKKRKPFLKLR